jgi:hypothetical protein
MPPTARERAAKVSTSKLRRRFVFFLFPIIVMAVHPFEVEVSIVGDMGERSWKPFVHLVSSHPHSPRVFLPPLYFCSARTARAIMRLLAAFLPKPLTRRQLATSGDLEQDSGSRIRDAHSKNAPKRFSPIL